MYIKNGDRADRLASRPFSPTTLTTPRVKDKSGSKRCLSANGNSVYLIDTLSKVPTYLCYGFLPRCATASSIYRKQIGK